MTFLKRMRCIVGLQGTDDRRDDEIYRAIRFVDDISNDAMRSLKKFGVSAAFKSTNIKNLITYGIQKCDQLMQSGVYSITCGDCSAEIIRQSGRNLSIRLAEHKKNLNTSCVGKHLKNTKYNPDSLKVKLLHQEKNYNKRLILEQLEIDKSTMREKKGIARNLNGQTFKANTKPPLYRNLTHLRKN